MDGMTYMNCGDWVESCTALMERHDGEIELLRWTDPARQAEPGRAAVAHRPDLEDWAA